MLKNRMSAAAFVLTLALAGCSWDEDVVPVMTGDTAPEAAAAPGMHLPHGGVTQFKASDTPAGKLAADLRGQLASLQSDIDAAYTKEQAAQAAAGVADMQGAAAEYTTAKGRAEALLSQTRDAYNMEGVTDEDRHQLSVLEGEVNRTASAIDQAAAALDTRIAQATAAAKPQAASSDLPIAGPELPAPELAAGAKPFVTIRFEQPDVAYQSQLATAINQAKQRRPGATFDLVAVSPSIGSPADVHNNTRQAQKNAKDVMQYLTSVGVAPEHITLSATTNTTVVSNEVRIYVR
jgi:hypothetical protein